MNRKVCELVDGFKVQFREASIDIDTPYFTGRVLADVMDSPFNYLMICYIEGATGRTKVCGFFPEATRVHAVQTTKQTKNSQRHISRKFQKKFQVCPEMSSDSCRKMTHHSDMYMRRLSEA